MARHTRRPAPPRRPPRLEELEARILHSADLAVAVLGAPGDGAPLSALVAQAWQPTQQAQARELAFIHPQADGAGALQRWLAQRAARGQPVQAHVLDATEDGLARMGQALAGEQGLGTLHLALPARDDGALLLGARPLTLDMLDQQAETVARWGQALADDARMAWHGGTAGHPVAQAMAQLAGVPVADGDALQTPGQQVVFIDGSLQDAAGLAALWRTLPVQVVLLDGQQDGLAQVAQWLASAQGENRVQAIHLVGHGSAGQVQLGSTRLDATTLAAHAHTLRQWAPHLAPGADLLLYGCDVAGNDAGRALLGALRGLTGADVAASTNRTGSAELGADWLLEAHAGTVAPQWPQLGERLAGWAGTLATFTVISTDDNTLPGTLRWAIEQANANGNGLDTIDFSLPGTGVHTIRLASALPIIAGAVFIDATSDDSFAANGNRPAIVLSGDTDANGSPDVAEGLRLQGAGSNGSTVQGLVFQRFGGSALVLSNSHGNTVAGNWVGLSDTGTAAAANGLGLNLFNAGANLLQGNVVSGNLSDAVRIEGGTADANVLQGNLIGTSANGSALLGNGGNGIAVRNGADNTTLGGTGPGQGNVVAGSTLVGIELGAVNATVVQANRIGTDATGTALWGNGEEGLWLHGGTSNTLVGGTSAAAANVIAHNGGGGVFTPGIAVWDATSLGNAFLGNSLHSSLGQGIDLNNDGVNANDTGDADSGPNGLQNHPTLATARTDGTSQVVVTGALASAANSHYRVEFFADAVQDSTGHGEGRTYLGFAHVATDGSGLAAIAATLSGSVPVGAFITATATASNADFTVFSSTSEFARNVAAVSSTQATLAVTTTSDTADGDTTSFSTLLAHQGADGLISLREALTAANNTANGTLPNRISFDIAGAGVHTITPTTALPDISNAVVLDASTDDSFAANGLAPAIVLDGNDLAASGLRITPSGGGSTVRGLVIRDFGQHGIWVEPGSNLNTIAGNYIGRLTPAGSDAGAGEGNALAGIWVQGSSNTIGGTAALDRNVLSGNGLQGIALDGAGVTGNLVAGNFIGLNAAGTGVLGNGNDGVYIVNGASSNTVGGATAAYRNVIAGNSDGVQFGGTGGFSNNNLVRNNYIGTDLTGTVDLGNNDDGVDIDNGASGNQVLDNLISGNQSDGIDLGDSGASTGTVVRGNLIGTSANASTALGNTGHGILVGNGGTADGSLIGGVAAGQGNTIAFNGGDGLYIPASTGVAVLGNSIYGNAGLAIDLGPDGVNPNDAGDADGGANDAQNFPVLSTARTSAADRLLVSGTLDSAASGFYRLEFFANASADPSGFGQAQTYLGHAHLATDATGLASFNAILDATVPVGSTISATATRASDGSFSSFSTTSELAANVLATGLAPQDVVVVPGLDDAALTGFYGFTDGLALGHDDAGGNAPIGWSAPPTQAVGPDGSGALLLAGGNFGNIAAPATGGAMTLAGWVRFDTTGDWQRVLDFGQANSDGPGAIYVGRLAGTNALTFSIEKLNAYTYRADAANAITNGTWLHFAATVDSAGQMALYINGSLAATQSGVAPDVAVRANHFVGKSNWAGDAPFEGAIDQLLVAQGALSAGQVAALYQQSTGLQVLENAANGSVLGRVLAQDPDAARVPSYSLLDSAGGRFAVDAVTGTVTVADGSRLDHEAAASHTIVVRATNSAGLHHDEAIVVTLGDQPEAPAGSDGSITTAEDTAYAFAPADFGFSDVDGDAWAQVLLTTLPGQGTLRLNGVAVNSGDAVAASDIALGRLTYTPPAEAAGAGLTSFSFQVRDDGGTALGGADTDASPNTLTIHVAAVNDLPVSHLPTALTIAEDTPTVLTGLSISDPDAGTDPLRAELTVTGGTLTATAGGGVAVTGSGTGTLVLTGALVDLNAFLAGAAAPVFQGSPNATAPVTLAMATSDGRNQGSAGVLDAGRLDYRFVDGAPAGSEPDNIAATGGVTGVATNFSSNALALALTGSSTSFGVVYTGVIDITTAGTYTFAASADDVARVRIDGNPVVFAFFGAGSGSVALAAGRHTVEVRHAQDSGGSALGVTMSGADTGNVATSLYALPGVGRLVGPTASTAITLTAVNDAPVLTAPTALQATPPNTALVLGSAQGNAITVADAEAGTLQLSLSVQHGTLTLAGTAGLAFSSGDGSGDAAMVATGSAAAINAALNGLQYQPAAGWQGADALALALSDLGASGSGGAQVANASVALQVGAARFQQGVAGYNGSEDTRLVSGAPGTAHGNEATVVADDDTPGDVGLLRFDNLFGNGAGQVPAGSVVHAATLSVYVTDRDAADSISLHRMLQPWSEASTYTSLGAGVQADGSEAEAAPLLSFSSGTLGWVNLSSAALTAAVQAWASGSAAQHGWAFVSNNADRWAFASSEAADSSLRPVLTLSFTPPQAPVVATSGGSASATENGAAVAVDPGLLLTDTDSTQLTGATVRISANYQNGQDELLFSAQAGITGSWDATSGTLSLSGNASVAQYQAALRSVAYRNTSDNPATAPRTVSFTAADAFVAGTGATRQVGVVAVNDAPVLGFVTGSASYTENAGAVLLAPAATVADVDNTHLNGGQLVVQFSANGQPEDRLAIRHQGNAAGQVGVAGSVVSYGGLAIGSFSGGGNGSTPLVVSLNADASVAAVQALARSITYQNVSDNPSLAVRSVQGWVTDGSGGTSNLASGTLSLQRVNDAPAGAPVVTGTLAEREVLAVDTASLADADGLGSYSYQWRRNGVAVVGATTAFYTLDAADVGALMSVRVAYTDGGGSAEQVLSAAVGPVANVNDPATGAPVVQGSAVEDQVLSADTIGMGDADGMGALSYQWLRDGVAVAGATASTYTLGDADVAHRLAVRVSYVDDQGTPEATTSGSTTSVASVNDTPSGQPVVAGPAAEDQVLSANTAGISDADGLGSFSYQWLRDGVAVAGATASTYTLGDADVGTRLAVRVNYLDGQGHAETLISAQTAPVASVNDAPTGQPVVSGNVVEDQTLSADTTAISDADGLGSFSYQWLRDGVAVAGATASAYTLGDADVGARLSVRVSYVDGQGRAEALTSAQTAPVASVNDAPTGQPAVIGSAVEDQTLSADTAGISDADGLGAFSYQWLRDGVAVAGAAASTYTLGDADVGARLSVRVSYLDGQGHGESLTSAQTAPVASVNDAPTGQPAVNGSAVEDQTLSADTTAISDADGLGSFSYQWLRDGVAVAGATASTYTLGDADVGTRLAARVNYLDGQGHAETLTSAQTAVVSSVNDTPAGQPAVIGSAVEDQTLSANTAGISDADGLRSFSYQWLRDGVAVAGATASTYTLGDADVGARLSVRVSYVDGQGNSEALTSTQSTPVASLNDAPTGQPVVSGSVVEDQTLSADTTAISDADGLGAFSYQWLRDGVAVAGATASTYTLGDADVGTRLAVRVNYLDGQGHAETLTSAQTAPVASVNDAPTGQPVVNGSAVEDQTLNADTTAISDVDGLGSFSYQWLRDGVAVAGATASSYTLGDADVGTRLAVRVNYLDGQGHAETLLSGPTAPVANVNDAPQALGSLPAAQAIEDQPFQWTLPAGLWADADMGDSVRISASGLPTWLQFDAATGRFSGTPGNADVGRWVLQVQATDAAGAQAQLSWQLSVQPVNNAPQAATPVPLQLAEGTQRTLGRAQLNASDVDDAASALRWQLLAAPQAGQLLLDGMALAVGGQFTQADVDAHRLAYQHDGSETHTDSLALAYRDAAGLGGQVLLPVQLAPVNNHAPVPLGPWQFSVAENTLAVARLGASDADAPGPSALQWALAGGADAQRFDIDAASGALRLRQVVDFEAPDDADANRRYELLVQVSDGQNTHTQAASVSVTDVNEAPQAQPAALASAEDQAVSGALGPWLQDPESAALSYSLAQPPQHGTLVLDDQGRFSYQPEANWHGSDSFVVQASDGLHSVALPVQLQVAAVDDAPALRLALPPASAATWLPLGPQHLQVLDTDTASTELLIQVGQHSGGHFEDTRQPGQVLQGFALADLAAGHIGYRITGSEQPQFSLRVLDASTASPWQAALLPRLDAGGAAAPDTSMPLAPPGADVLPPPATDSSALPATPPRVVTLARPVAAAQPPSEQARSAGGAALPGGDDNPATARQDANRSAARQAPLRAAAGTSFGWPGSVSLAMPEFEAWVQQLGKLAQAKGATGLAQAAAGQRAADEGENSFQAELGVLHAGGLALAVVALSWALRAGGILGSLVLTAPAWRLVDPLPVVGDGDDDEPGDNADAQAEALAAEVLDERAGP